MTAELIAERPTPGVPTGFTFPAFQRARLDNGLTVLSCELPGRGMLALSLLLDAGAALERADRGGVAALTAAAFSEGTAELDAAALAEAVEALGGDFSGRAGWESIRIDLRLPAGRLEEALELLASVVLNPVFPEAGVIRLRTERLGRISQERAQPMQRAAMAMGEMVYAAGSMYSRPADGSAGTVATLAREDVRAHYDAYATPGSATLIVAGDFGDAPIDMLAERVFARWRGAEAPRERAVAIEQLEQTHVTVVDRPESTQSAIALGHGGIRRSDPFHHAFEIANHVFAGWFGSRLNMRLREEKGFTYGVRSGFVSAREAGPFGVHAPVEVATTAESIRDTLEIMREMCDAGLNAEELEEAKTYLGGVLALRFETPDAVAAGLAELVLYDLPDDYFDRYGETLARLSLQDVADAARAHMHPDRVAIAVTSDASVVGATLEEFGPVTIARDDQ